MLKKLELNPECCEQCERVYRDGAAELQAAFETYEYTRGQVRDLLPERPTPNWFKRMIAPPVGWFLAGMGWAGAAIVLGIAIGELVLRLW